MYQATRDVPKRRRRQGLATRSGLRAGLDTRKSGFQPGQAPWYLRSYG